MIDIKKLALRVAKDVSEDGWLCGEDSVIDFATRFLAAYLAEQEPDGWIDGEGDPYYQHGWGKKPPSGWTTCEHNSYPVFRAPPLPEPAPQDGTTHPAELPARETPVGADLPEEAREMVERLRTTYKGVSTAGPLERDAADMLERLAARCEKLKQANDDLARAAIRPNGMVLVKAENLLAVRDALAHLDHEEAYHQLYWSADWADPYEPFAEWEAAATAPTPHNPDEADGTLRTPR